MIKKFTFTSIVILAVLFLAVQSASAIPAASTWNGLCSCVKDYIRDNAHDPRSIKYVECSPILEFDNGLYGQRVKYRR